MSRSLLGHNSEPMEPKGSHCSRHLSSHALGHNNKGANNWGRGGATWNSPWINRHWPVPTSVPTKFKYNSQSSFMRIIFTYNLLLFFSPIFLVFLLCQFCRGLFGSGFAVHSSIHALFLIPFIDDDDYNRGKFLNWYLLPWQKLRHTHNHQQWVRKSTKG